MELDLEYFRDKDMQSLLDPVYSGLYDCILTLLTGAQMARCEGLRVGKAMRPHCNVQHMQPFEITDPHPEAIHSARSHMPLLSSLKIFTCLMFTPLFRHLTIQLLNSPSITSLHLRLHISDESWRHLLQGINLPKLTTVTFTTSDQLSFDDFMAFLQRHPHVTCVHITNTLAGAREVCAKTFSTIEKIRTSPGLLSSVVRTGGMLHSRLNVVMRRVYPQLFDFMDDDLDALCAVEGDISLTIDVGRGVLEWFDYVGKILDSIPHQQRPEQGIKCVTKITLRFLTGREQRPTLNIARWLKLFPNVKKIQVMMPYHKRDKATHKADARQSMKEALIGFADDVEVEVTTRENEDER